MRQFLLAMEDMRDNNCEGKVYGSVLREGRPGKCSKTMVQKTNSIVVVFDSMDWEKEIWMKEGAMLVYYMNMVFDGGRRT
ncbi:hypothetical protein L211DRAFT_485927 [Terfezia boudieri ATCC MYA-4762]|uniref:Uncharacterized protein n=1 Tax=Terfezia boudieri ATCC MYA-4762 TaxID=1051890 RepID=A0A3N4MHC5_9PEZI|nr:hypothetical protein L211DRAFT_485927 [Terfezia boudieri ATCC MYA-4762]